MAGLVFIPNTIHERQHASALLRRQMIDASVTLHGLRFTTTIREGASAEELIEKVAKENGGGVARVYYPEFRTWEIVAVKIGDLLLVKGDRKKVAEADFSQFPDSMRREAMAAASRSDGGIHFSLGSSGIPMAMAGEEIVFPNAEELRVRKETSSIALWMTAANVNPVDLNDLARVYSASGGIRVSPDAKKQIEVAHGGVRSEKLLLEDNILVLDKDTGEIRTASEYADKIKVEGFAAPQFQTSSYTSVGLAMHCENGLIALPMDGSAHKVPYLFVKTFDGKIADHVLVQFNPLPEAVPIKQKVVCPELAAASVITGAQTRLSDERPTALPAPQTITAPVAIEKSRKKSETSQPIAKVQLPKSPLLAYSPSMKIDPETIRYYWLKPRPAFRECEVLSPAPPVSPLLKKNRALSPAPPRKMKMETETKKPVEPAKRRRKPVRNLAPLAEKPLREARKPKAKAGRDLPEAGRKKRKPKPQAEIAHKKKEVPKPNHMAATEIAIHKPKNRKNRVTAIEIPLPKTRNRAKMPAHFLMEMLGLLPKRQWKSRGRKFSAKKRRAP